jgi:hypothetical protein
MIRQFLEEGEKGERSTKLKRKYEFLDCHSCVAEDLWLLGCEAVSFYEQLLKF